MNADSEHSDPPQTQTETSRSSGDGKYPPSKTALGLEDGGAPNYSKGEKLKCRVIGFRSGGFEILIIEDGITGFLKSEETRNLGDEFVAEFERWQDRKR